MRVRGLRERGVYRLPDGQEVVVSACGGQEYCAFASPTYDSFGLAEYLITAEGRILKGTEPTGWGAEDLSDTGRTAPFHVLGHTTS
jgi:hypothetical protein